ncbi:MAG: hypothetical protein GXP27_18665 [Planctomycetes bacterium]|nr:hypothetical protein [Planctomycetota bacterium]
MHWPAGNTVLADVNDLVGVIVMVIAFLGWLLNALAQGKREANRRKVPGRPRPRAQAGGARDPRLDDEIEMFLEQIQGKPKPAPQRPVPPQGPRSRSGRPPIRPRRPPRQPATPAPPRPSPQQRPALTERRALSERVRPGEQIAKRRLTGPEQLGSTIRKHVDEYIGKQQVSEHVRQHILAAVKELEQEIIEDLGPSTGTEPPPAHTSRNIAVASIVHLLSTPAGARQAIVLGEIFGRPKALRRN